MTFNKIKNIRPKSHETEVCETYKEHVEDAKNYIILLNRGVFKNIMIELDRVFIILWHFLQ